MEINTTKETLNVNKVICEKKEMINIQGDMIVPDAKPDILNTINTTGNACIYKKEIMDGKIRLDGSILTYIMYLADGEKDNIRGINTGLDFSETINIPELEIGMNVDVATNVKLIECKVINGRKIGIKVTLEIVMKIYSRDDVEIITDLNNENIQVLSQNMKINSKMRITVLAKEAKTSATTGKESYSLAIMQGAEAGSLFTSLLSTAICKASQPFCFFAFLFYGNGLDPCLLYNVTNLIP